MFFTHKTTETWTWTCSNSAQLRGCKQSSSGRHTSLIRPMDPLQVWEVRFDLRETFRLMVEMTKRDLHAAKLFLKSRKAISVWARVVLALWPSLLHTGWVVQRLGFTKSVPGSLTLVHAVFPTVLHHVPTHPNMRHVIHVWYAIVHHGERHKKSSKSTPRTVRSQKTKNIRSKKEHQATWTWQRCPGLDKKRNFIDVDPTNVSSTKSTDRSLHL